VTTLLYVTPHPAYGATLPTRPGALLDALVASHAFDTTVVVNRVRPFAFLRARLGRDGRPPVPGVQVVEHAWPFGTRERRFLTRLAGSLSAPVTAWVADPKSALFLADLGPSAIGVLDAYDAWDLSPLVVGERRRNAVRDGYRVAARHARIVFANTELMADRLRDLGAADVRQLPNAAPVPDPIAPDAEPSLVYVGRIHERFSCELVAAAAEHLPAVTFRIVGPVERTPEGWASLLDRPNIRHEGALDADAARAAIGRSRGLLIPHAVDDYTRSQDAMKAWDAISVGAPVLATPIPPVDRWPPGLALVATGPAEFAAAADRIVSGELDARRGDRLAFAAANGWAQRAAEVVEAIREVGP
jgi:glycosyltransferase involved in cell wall biosynthesis